MRLDRLLRYSGSALAAVVLLAVAPSAHGATTVYVANHGTDSTFCGFFVIGGFTCGAKESPCRSISCAVREAAAGDKIIVGPGRYGDLNRDGALNDDGDEFGSSGCDCMLSVNKSVSLLSSHGAAVTVIDATSVNVAKNVLLILDGGEFGSPGKGFTVTGTLAAAGHGIDVDSNDVKIRGNQVVGRIPMPAANVTRGITVVGLTGGTVLIEANQVTGWIDGIVTQGAGQTVRRNVVTQNRDGINAGGDAVVRGNVAAGNFGVGITVLEAAIATGNTAYGNFIGFRAEDSGFSGRFEKNNVTGNVSCGLHTVTATNAMNNYWGAATGPGPDPADAPCDTGHVVTTTPFATKPFTVSAPIRP
jgi:hypothetical protein